MKRLLLLPLIIVLILSGCSIKSYTPVMPAAINQIATVTTGDFSYDCEICRDDECVKLKALTTKAKGLVMIYDGDELTFSYENMDSTIPADNYESTNPAIIIYNVFEDLDSISSEAISRIDNGFKINGKIPLGEYTLLINDDGKVNTLTLKSSDIVFKFK